MKPTTYADIPALLARWAGRDAKWYERAAVEAHARGHSRFISARNLDELYMLRFWLTPPVKSDDEGLESGGSVLLHHFIRADDDASLHDHPWDFDTTILVGGYREHLPPLDWDAHYIAGPRWDERIVPHVAGATVRHQAAELHCVGAVDPGTWTLVRTGPRSRGWGFHPPGLPWTPAKVFLGLAAA